ncbi:MAG TPA: D-xylose ABC transporter ATP-binding protein [Elusimicrobia bacterium]|nr:D-xylose ABC transporter ATP-binding protein [Elusimicrobiota bacterium]
MASEPNTHMLEMKGIIKEFPGVKALDGVDFSAGRGEIHALVGENGAGKSTLMKVLSGVYPHGTYAGEIIVDGKPCRFASTRDSEKAGIAVIYQELALVRQMSVAENIVLGSEPSAFGVLDRGAAFKRAEAALKLVGLNVNPGVPVSSLGVGQQQLVEIAKALTREARILVLDEPTAALSDGEAEHLLGILRDLRKKGVTCIYISHRLKEIFEIADNISVLRDGRTVGTFPASTLDEGKLIAKMVGRELKDIFPARVGKAGEAALEVAGWSATDEASGMELHDINLTVRKGEIVGLAGLVGAGRTELAMSVFGAWGNRTAGTVKVAGKEPAELTPGALIRAGAALASEDRKRWGLVLVHDVKSNITLSSLDALSRGGLVDGHKEVAQAATYVKSMAIKTPTLEQKAGNLSGGNQQKIVLSKCLMTEPRALILDEPTRGIDVGAKVEIYSIIRKLADSGVGILMISSELPEIIGMCDRVLVMRDGRVSGELGAGASQEEIMHLAVPAD